MKSNKTDKKQFATFGDAVQHFAKQQTERDALIAEMAREKHQSDGQIEIDANTIVSEGGDNGAYVMAWVWVSFEDTPLDTEKEEEASSDL